MNRGRKPNQLFYFILGCSTLILAVVYCSVKPQPTDYNTYHLNDLVRYVDSSLLDVPLEKKTKINYFFDTVGHGDSSRYSSLSSEHRDIVLSLNRISEGFVRKNSILVFPDTFLINFLDYSPFPLEVMVDSTLPKVIFIAQHIQAFSAYENGKLVRWGPVSSGKRSTPTPNGLYHTNWKAKLKRSTVNSEWLMPWYYNIENMVGIGMHEYLLPGYPASHACIRLMEKDAVWIYNWAEGWKLDKNNQIVIEHGTPVYLFGLYDYEDKYPWRNLVEDVNSNDIEEFELTNLL